MTIDSREYWIEARDNRGHWFIAGSERGCTEGWAVSAARKYKALFPFMPIRVKAIPSKEIIASF